MPDHIDFQVIQVLDVNGDPEAGAKAYFYETGTSTPVTVYSDEALSTAHPSPLIADSGGNFAPVYYGGTVDLKVTVTDAADVVLDGYPIDPVRRVPTGATGAAQISFTPITGNTATDAQTAIANNTASALVEENARIITLTGGSSTVYTLSAPNTITAYATGQSFPVQFHTATGVSPTINIDGVGAIGLMYINSSGTLTALPSGGIQTNMVARVTYDGTYFVVTDGLSLSSGSTPGLLKLLDEDDMASDSASWPASQQSTKAFVNGKFIGWAQTTGSTLTNSGGFSSVQELGSGVGSYRYKYTFDSAEPDTNYMVLPINQATVSVRTSKVQAKATTDFEIVWTNVGGDQVTMDHEVAVLRFGI